MPEIAEKSERIIVVSTLSLCPGGRAVSGSSPRQADRLGVTCISCRSSGYDDGIDVRENALLPLLLFHGRYPGPLADIDDHCKVVEQDDGISRALLCGTVDRA